MPKRRITRRPSRTIPKVTIPRGEEIKAELTPPGALLGELMPTEIMKGKVTAEESGGLIVWDNRQKTT